MASKVNRKIETLRFARDQGFPGLDEDFSFRIKGGTVHFGESGSTPCGTFSLCDNQVSLNFFEGIDSFKEYDTCGHCIAALNLIGEGRLLLLLGALRGAAEATTAGVFLSKLENFCQEWISSSAPKLSSWFYSKLVELRENELFDKSELQKKILQQILLGGVLPFKYGENSVADKAYDDYISSMEGLLCSQEQFVYQHISNDYSLTELCRSPTEYQAVAHLILAFGIEENLFYGPMLVETIIKDQWNPSAVKMSKCDSSGLSIEELLEVRKLQSAIYRGPEEASFKDVIQSYLALEKDKLRAP